MNRIKVAIIDSGIDYNHDFLKSSIQNGYELRLGKNGVIYENNFEDEYSHGTACASVILKECRNIEFIIVKVMNNEGKTNLLLVEEALKSLVDTDVTIINMSFAINKNVDSNLFNICNELVKRNKILVASMANNNSKSFPAYFDNVIGVRGAVLKNSNTIWFNRNKEIQCIVDNNPSMCCNINNTYQIVRKSNSLATAKLTGLICEIISRHKNISNYTINYESICMELEKYSCCNEWSDNDLLGRKRSPNKQEWYIENNNILLNKIYEIVKEKVEMQTTSDYICNYELLTSNGGLKMDKVYELINYISDMLCIDINYMDISRFDLLTLGTLTKFLESYL